MKSKFTFCAGILLFGLLVFVSCGKFKLIEVYGLTNDYDKISQETKEKVFTFENMESAKHGYAYKITGEQLRKATQPYEKSLVHIIPGACYGDHCVSISSVESYASENGYKLFLLDFSYIYLENLLKEVKASPILIMNSEHYKKKKIRRFVPLFMADFLSEAVKDNPNIMEHSFYFFEHGRLIAATDDLPGFNNP